MSEHRMCVERKTTVRYSRKIHVQANSIERIQLGELVSKLHVKFLSILESLVRKIYNSNNN